MIFTIYIVSKFLILFSLPVDRVLEVRFDFKNVCNFFICRNEIIITRNKPVVYFKQRSRFIFNVWPSRKDLKRLLQNTVKPVVTTTFLKRPQVKLSSIQRPPVQRDQRPLKWVPDFYYLHITTTAQSAYPGSHNKFSQYFSFKVIYNMLFYHNIVLCFERKYTDLFLSESCVIKWKVMLPLNNNQI